MRLAPNEVRALQRSVAELLPKGAVVRLFGSRVDDAKRGGDIDLLVETPSRSTPPTGPTVARDWSRASNADLRSGGSISCMRCWARTTLAPSFATPGTIASNSDRCSHEPA